MRASLRGSRKLKALQDNKAGAQQQQPVAAERSVIGVENEAYVEDEDVEKVTGKCAKSLKLEAFKLEISIKCIKLYKLLTGIIFIKAL